MAKLDFIFVGPHRANEFPWSPFGAKLEVRLKLSEPCPNYNKKLEFWLWRRAPHKKMPFIGLSDGTLMPDSTLCIKYLVETGQLEDWNSRLDGVQKAQDLCIRTLFEDRLFFIYAWEIYHQPGYWSTMRDEGVLGSLAWPIRYAVFAWARYVSSKTLWRQGISRFDPKDIRIFSEEILDGLNEIIQNVLDKAIESPSKPVWVLGGDRPSEADATIFGFFMSALQSPRGRMSAEQARSRPAIMDYLKRIHKAHFSDYPILFEN